MTNFEKIKQMDINELAFVIMCPYDNDGSCLQKESCIDCCKKWLEKEVQEDE